MIEMLSIFLVVIPGVLWSYMATPVSPTLLNSPADKLPASPRAKIKNGTLQGVYLPSFHQDAFLGVPFAKPPLGDLRFRHPQTYNNTWKGVNDASARKPSCPAAFGSAAYGVGALDLAEDCLYLDIVRPSDVASGAKLPVMAWIYGGAFNAGGSADPRYNTSYMVRDSVSIREPTMTVSINYRVAALGFLASKEVAEEGGLNAGLFDQRLALYWIKENIAAFGGDPEKVTIWGESAGVFSVGHHLNEFDGNNDGLFRAGIMQSGTSLGYALPKQAEFTTTYQPMYDNITAAVGCANKKDTLQCLRETPFPTLYGAIYGQSWSPVVDGDFLRRSPSESLSQGLFAHVAIPAGTNTDEATQLFSTPRGTLNNDSDISALIRKIGRYNDTVVDTLMQLYPDDPSLGCPFNTGDERFASQGFQYKRAAAITGDFTFHAGRRQTLKYFASLPAEERKPVYSYRFDQPPWDNSIYEITTIPPVGSTHFSEVALVFNNPSISLANWIGPYANYSTLASTMSKSWVSFAHDLDPNFSSSSTENSSALVWPRYEAEGGKNMVFRAGDTSEVEVDDWRAEQLEYWTGIWGEADS